MPTNTENRTLTPAARAALVAAIEAAMNANDLQHGAEPSQFNGGDAAEEVWIWEQGGRSSWIDQLPWWELPISMRPVGWSLLQRPCNVSEESWEGLSFDR